MRRSPSPPVEFSEITERIPDQELPQRVFAERAEATGTLSKKLPFVWQRVISHPVEVIYHREEKLARIVQGESMEFGDQFSRS